MSDLERQVRGVLHALWKRRWLSVAVAWTVGIVAIPAALIFPERYESVAKVYVDTDTVLKPMMSGLAFTADIDTQVRILARTLISRPNVERLIEKPGLDFSVDGERDREILINKLMQKILITPAGAGNLYTITYRDTNAVRANRLVEATLELFVNSGAQGKKKDSAEASEFIDQQIRDYEGKLIEAENRLKNFKVKHFAISGVSSQDFFTRVSVLSDEVNKLRTELSGAEQARDALRRELAGESPQLPPEAAVVVPAAPTEVELRLEAQRKALDELSRRYTDEHPDVAALRRVIAQLEREKRIEAQARAASAAAGGGKLAATSPVYQKIRVSLAEAEAQVASIRSRLSQAEVKLQQIRSTAGQMPQIEAELAQLNRDYDVINKNYQALVARRESASLGIKLDESSRLADFRVVEPPRVGPGPVFPSRVHVAAIAAGVALAAAIGVALLLEFLYPTYRDAGALTKATGRPVLGRVSMVTSPADRQTARRHAFGIGWAYAVLIVVQGGWVAWLATRTIV